MIKRLLEFYRRTRGPIVTGNGVVSTWASTILRQPHVRKMIESGGDGKANDFTGI